jgi:hypothetical protein
MNLLHLYRRRQYTNVYNMYKVLAVYYIETIVISVRYLYVERLLPHRSFRSIFFQL